MMFRYLHFAGWLVLGLGLPLAAAMPPSSPAPAFAAGLAPALPADFKLHSTARYVLAYTGERAWAEQTGRLLEQVREDFCRTFTDAGFRLNEHADPLPWVCFAAGGDYAAYGLASDHADVSWTDAYYSSRTNRVVLLRSPKPLAAMASSARPGIGDDPAPARWVPPPHPDGIDPARIRHEACHQLSFNLGLQKRGVMYPIWVSEGLAIFFEPAATAAAPRDNFPRRLNLLDASFRGRLRRLEDFVVVTDLPGRSPADDAATYAQAWGLWAMLLQQQPAQLRQYLEAIYAQPPGRRDAQALRQEFIRAFGSLDAVSASWQQYLEQQRQVRTVAAVEPADSPAASGSPRP